MYSWAADGWERAARQRRLADGALLLSIKPGLASQEREVSGTVLGMYLHRTIFAMKEAEEHIERVVETRSRFQRPRRSEGSIVVRAEILVMVTSFCKVVGIEFGLIVVGYK